MHLKYAINLGGHSMASGGLILISHGSRTESEFHRNPAIFAYQVRVPYFPRAIGISNSKTSVRAAYDYCYNGISNSMR